MIGLRRYFKIPNNGDEYFIIQKLGNALPSKLGINPEDVLNYIIVKKTITGYDLIDFEDESDGFESYQGAEQ